MKILKIDLLSYFIFIILKLTLKFKIFTRGSRRCRRCRRTRGSRRCRRRRRTRGSRRNRTLFYKE
jgi:hypothetical protein